jgi:hypothetical protein
MRFTPTLQVLTVALLLTPIIHAGEDSTDTKESVTIDPLTAAQAVERAILYTGFDSLRQLDRAALESNAQHALVTDTTIPYLQEYFDARPAWVVEFQDITVHLFHSREGAPARDYQVYIDEETGVLLKVVSRAPWYDPSVIRKPNAEAAAEDLGEVYKGFPPSPPPVGFALALDTASRMGIVREAMEIVGLYISYKDDLHYVGPAWDIHFYGLTVVGFRPDLRRPIWMRNHIRVVVNAETGKPILADNLPYAPEE